MARNTARISALTEAKTRLSAGRDEARTGLGVAESALAELPPSADLEGKLAAIRTEIEGKRVSDIVREILERHSMQFDLEWTVIGEPFLTPRGRLVDALMASVESVSGVRPTLSTSGGTSDGRFLARLAREVVEFGPLNLSIHKIDEHVRVADLGPLSMIYERTVMRFFELP